ncbi:tetratricopeptide repeat protein, partial [Candidatus Poribacteria bacterium]|nr:tetratricopeptide repeat protein [Candidatus Poribacteria bacterium]
SPMEEADIAYSSALDQQASGEHEAAIAEFKQYIGQFPKSQDADNAQLGIGDIHYAKGEFQAAIDAYQTILTQYPTSDSADLAQLKIGDAYLAQGDLTQSTAAYHQLVEKYPYHEVEAAQLAEQRLHTIETIRTLRQSLPTAEQSTQDNIQYRLGTLYFEELADYKTAIEEFQKLISLTPDSKLADNAQWMIGECYWRLGQSDPTPPLGEIGEALVRRQHIIDRYPQLAGLDRYNTDGSPHWPTGGRGDRYELYFAELRRLLNRYPDLKARKWSDFVSENYRHALSAWDMLLLQYPDTDAAAIAPQKIAERFVQLGQTYMNLSSGGSYSDLSGLILKASLAYWPTPQAHIALAYYYAEIVKYDRWTYYRTRPFEHLKEAAKLVPPGSPLAAEIRSIKEQMNYRLRIEELENHSGPRQR